MNTRCRALRPEAVCLQRHIPLTCIHAKLAFFRDLSAHRHAFEVSYVMPPAHTRAHLSGCASNTAVRQARACASSAAAEQAAASSRQNVHTGNALQQRLQQDGADVSAAEAATFAGVWLRSPTQAPQLCWH